MSSDHMKWILGAVATCVLAIGGYMIPFTTAPEFKLPEHLVSGHMQGPSSISHRQFFQNILIARHAGSTARICLTYELLVRYDRKYLDHPPNLYTFLNVPRPDDTDIRSLLAQILAQLDEATEGFHEILRTYDRDTPTYREARRGVRTWYKIAAVLLDAPVRRVYDDKFRGGRNVGEVLGGLCGQRWDKGEIWFDDEERWDGL
ncbi:hypothetical protein ACHAPU_010119 [Fusarium lateritium]